MDSTFLKRITYSDLRDKIKIGYNDSYSMISDYLTPSVVSTLLSNPNLVDNLKSAMNLIINDGAIVGRNMLMPTKVKIDNQVFMVQSGGSYEIHEQFRGRGLGTIAFRDSILNAEYDMYIGQLYSTTAIDIVRKLGLIVFELPSYYKLCGSRAILESKGLEGIQLRICKAISDSILRIFDIPNLYRLKKLCTQFCVEKVDVVPAWVNEITLHDGHEFMEVHDSEWLQWCLHNRFTDCSQDNQAFYIVYDKANNPKGFFMTKKRFETSQGKYKNITRGTIVEWGSYNEDELSEIDLNLLAIYSFDSTVDNITTVLTNSSFDKAIRKLRFIRHGNYQMTIHPGNVNNSGLSDQSKWRIRYGGCNTIVF